MRSGRRKSRALVVGPPVEAPIIFDKGRVYPEAEAAALLGMNRRQLAKRRRAGKIACVKDGHFIAYLPEQIAQYCETFRRDVGFMTHSMTTEEMVEALCKHMAAKKEPRQRR